MKTNGYAARSATEPLAPWSFERRATGPRDVAIEILFCGVCHSDLHTVRSEWPGTVYPAVPGHEIVGRVIETGAEVRRFKVGGLAAVGCIVDSCRKCPNCREGLEQFCDAGLIGTPPMNFVEGRLMGDGAPTLGFRPEDVVLVPAGTAGSIPAEVVLVELLGAHAHLHLDAGPHRLIAVVSGADAPAKGARVHVRLDPARAHRFDAGGTRMEGP